MSADKPKIHVITEDDLKKHYEVEHPIPHATLSVDEHGKPVWKLSITYNKKTSAESKEASNG